MSRWIFLFLSILFENHLKLTLQATTQKIATRLFLWKTETEVRETMAASVAWAPGVGSIDHPVFVCDKLSVSILRSELSTTTRFTPDASGAGNKACVTLTAAAAAARGDHHTFNSWVPLTCLWPRTHRVILHIYITTYAAWKPLHPHTHPLSKKHTLKAHAHTI